MKGSGWRGDVVCLVMVVFLVWPVYANPISTTLVNYSIYRNNEPIDDSINLSVKCYGTYQENYFNARHLPENRSAITNLHMIYSYSLSCEPNHCFRKDVYGYTTGMIISSCDMDGMYKGKFFAINNFTTNPEPTCILSESVSYGGYGREIFTSHYAVNDEGRTECYARYYLDKQNNCDKFLEPDRPDILEHHYYEYRNKTRYIATDEYVQCSQQIKSKLRVCFEAHSLTNLTVMQEAHRSLYCEQRFDIPSDNQTPLVSISQIPRTSYTPQSPVESLYCSIISIFGARC